MLEKHDVVVATFVPQKKDDLREFAKQHIGKCGEWTAAFLIEDGLYAGQFAMIPIGNKFNPITWVPFCDLKIKGD
jgi:hypothetical protein